VAQEIPDGLVMEPIFIVEAAYGPDAAELRPPHRPAHLTRMAAQARVRPFARVARPDEVPA
jgi:hypothetical protein